MSPSIIDWFQFVVEKNKSFGGIAGIEKASKLIHSETNFICFGIDDKSVISNGDGSDWNGDEEPERVGKVSGKWL